MRCGVSGYYLVRVRVKVGLTWAYGVWARVKVIGLTGVKGYKDVVRLEMWDLKVKGTDVIGYNQRFQEHALMCVRMFPEESDKVEKYVGGLPDMLHGSVVASKPKTTQDAIEIATELMAKKIRTLAERQAENKRKFDNNDQAQQQFP
ncbi:hypothetical protein Tco_0772105 [Tanacetum coccineum]|uniref:Reverse transcriptase domain-containing protein n=1 Tax=Tanacetum coccineum TaxID=301880 RepID=A0ABQ4ZGZ8_9ASTR